MVHRLVCDCGFVVAEEDADRLVALVQDHALSAHQVDLSAEQILGLAANTEVTGPGHVDDDAPIQSVPPPPGPTTDAEE